MYSLYTVQYSVVNQGLCHCQKLMLQLVQFTHICVSCTMQFCCQKANILIKITLWRSWKKIDRDWFDQFQDRIDLSIKKWSIRSKKLTFPFYRSLVFCKDRPDRIELVDLSIRKNDRFNRKTDYLIPNPTNLNISLSDSTPISFCLSFTFIELLTLICYLKGNSRFN